MKLLIDESLPIALAAAPELAADEVSTVRAQRYASTAARSNTPFLRPSPTFAVFGAVGIAIEGIIVTHLVSYWLFT